MTDQQAPERIWFYRDEIAGWLGLRESNPGPDGVIPEPYVRLDLLEAAEKRIKELEVGLRQLLQLVEDSQNDARELQRLAKKAEAERDQALAASAAREIAMRDRAAECEEEVGIAFGFCRDETGDEYNQGWIDCTEHWLEEIRAIPPSPDATAALNEMLAKAWDEGQDTYQEWPLEKNPYRPCPHRPHSL